ncbi:MAG: hypothetical protein ABSA77_08360 [Thermoguttaceae bacterium]|jgi:hypothetical protein
MHTRELVELSAIISAHGPVLVRGAERLSAAGMEEYWTASKIRLDRWGFCLREFIAKAADAKWHKTQWHQVRGTLEEIITGEILTRVWTAVVCAHDRQHGGEDAGPIARSVLLGHTDARHRVLTLLVGGPGVDAEDAMKLNLLRRRSERWTDMLIGYLAGLHDCCQFAVDQRRAMDFSQDLHYQCRQPGGRHAWPLVLASIKAAFQQGMAQQSPNADLNGRIASSILSCFQPELFDSTGLFCSMWLMRLANAANDAQGMIDELLAAEESSRAAKDTPGNSAYSRNRKRFE